MKSFYFQHDYNAANDHKILFLRQQLGIEGYGIFWYIVEQLAQAGGYLPLKIIPVLAMQIQTTADKVASVIKNYDLFEFEQEEFFSTRLLKQIEFRNELAEAGKRGALKRWQNKQIDSPPNSPPIGDAYSNKRKESKEKKIKYAENVRMTEAEYDRLLERFGESGRSWVIEKLDNYKGAKGTVYKSDYRAILSWVADEWQKHKPKKINPY